MNQPLPPDEPSDPLSDDDSADEDPDLFKGIDKNIEQDRKDLNRDDERRRAAKLKHHVGDALDDLAKWVRKKLKNVAI